MADEIITMGRLGSSYGVHGWLKVITFSENPNTLLDYSNWLIQHNNKWQSVKLEAGKIHAKSLVAKLSCCTNREQCREYTNDLVGIKRSELPQPEDDEIYWNDLIGLKVSNQEGIDLGVVDHVFDTGSNDVLVVKGERERYIPYLKDVILDINLETRCIQVNWDAEF